MLGVQGSVRNIAFMCLFQFFFFSFFCPNTEAPDKTSTCRGDGVTRGWEMEWRIRDFFCFCFSCLFSSKPSYFVNRNIFLMWDGFVVFCF